MSKIPKSRSDIDNKWLETVFCNYFNTSVQIQSHCFRESPLKGDNITSNISMITVDILIGKELRTIHIVMKTTPESETGRSFIAKSKLFQRECYVYRQYLPYLQNRFNSDLFPTFYFGKEEDGYGVIITIDLCKCGYVMKNRMAQTTIEEASAAIRGLSRFHAYGHLALLWQKSFDFESDLSLVSHPETETFVAKCLSSFWNIVTNDLPEYKEYRKSIKNLLTTLGVNPFMTQDKSPGPFLTINHGDMWTNNILFDYSSPSSPSVKFIDWQFPNVSSGIIDLSYFIFSSLTPDFRHSHLDSLLHLYLTTYKEELTKYTDIEENFYSYEALTGEFDNLRKFHFFVAIFFTRTFHDNNVSSNINSEDFSILDYSHSSYYSPAVVRQLKAILDEFIADHTIVPNQAQAAASDDS